jgi:cell division transport system permease protein
MGRLGYFSRETLVSLRRNLLMTLAGIITVCISLWVLGTALMLARLVDHGTQQWKNGVQLEVFMNVDATQGQIEAVQTALDEDPNVRDYRFLTKEDAYEEFKRLFRENPDLIETVEPDRLPTSFRVAPQRAELTRLVADTYRTSPGVDEVQTADKAVKNLLNGTRAVRYVFLGVSLALALASLFLIVNTIRLATFARRREIEVMKLVGASNWFVRIPFMLEGVVQGLIGAALAVGGVALVRQALEDLIARDSAFSRGFYVTGGDVRTVGLIVLLAGALVGALGSFVGLRRFLDV